MVNKKTAQTKTVVWYEQLLGSAEAESPPEEFKRAPAGKQEALNQSEPYGSLLILTRNSSGHKLESDGGEW